MSETRPSWKDVLTFLCAAKDHWKQIVGGSLVFLLIGLAASVGLNVPPLISFIAAFCFAVLLACFLCWREKADDFAERLKPRLQLTLDNRQSIAHAVWNDGHLKTFLRVIVSSTTPYRIENARGYLVSIERDSKVLLDNEELPLTFAPGENPDAVCKTIEHGGKYPLDVLVVRHGDNALFAGTPGRRWLQLVSLDEIFSDPGEYVVNIRVSATHSPSILAKMKFIWTGDASNCGIDLIPPS